MQNSIQIAITGVTITGNMGGQAMLFSSLYQIKSRFPDACMHLFSVYPEQDNSQNSEPKLSIVDSRPYKLMLIYMPLMLILWPLRKLRLTRILLRSLSYFEAVYECDLLLDHSGIAFVDGRGLPLLAYNVACALPGLFAGIPVVKLSQALGPFENTANRVLAKWVLRRCDTVIARGDTSARFLESLSLTNARSYPDVAFTLEVSEKDREEASARLSNIGISCAPVIVSPSKVVANMSLKAGIDLAGELTRFIADLLERGEIVLLLPHSLSQGDDKNNDVTLCRYFFHQFEHPNIFLIDDVSDSRRLRAIIGCGKAFIGSRFHAVVSALAEGIPLVVIGWSHKYAELMRMFGAEKWVLDHTDLSRDVLMRVFGELSKDLPGIRESLKRQATGIKRRAANNYEILERIQQ